MAKKEDEEIIEDLNLDDSSFTVDNSIAEAGRPLPKKVELDIDDMAFEDDEEEIPEVDQEPEIEPVEVQPAEEEPAPPRRRWSRPKILVLIALVLLPLLIGGGVAYKLFFQPEPPPEEPAGPPSVNLKPFLINYPGPQKDTIATLTLKIVFPNPVIEEEFNTRSPVVRDLIFRYVQGLGPQALTAGPEARDLMLIDLANIINSTLEPNRILKVDILEFKEV